MVCKAYDNDYCNVETAVRLQRKFPGSLLLKFALTKTKNEEVPVNWHISRPTLHVTNLSIVMNNVIRINEYLTISKIRTVRVNCDVGVLKLNKQTYY